MKPLISCKSILNNKSLLTLLPLGLLPLFFCTTTVSMPTPLGISLDVDASAKMDTLNANKVSITDDYGQKILLQRFSRSSLSDAEIGQAILDSAKKIGIDLKAAKPKKISSDGLIGSLVVGEKNLFSGFIARKSTDGYFMRIDFDGTSDDDAINTAESVRKITSEK